MKFQTFSAQIADQFVEERMLSRLMVLFGCLAGRWPTIGLYGVTSYSVARRTSEIGIRMALGEERSKVVVMILSTAMTQTLIGLAFGGPTAYYCVRFVRSQLYELTNVNPLALFGAVLILLVATLVAGWVPGRRPLPSIRRRP